MASAALTQDSLLPQPTGGLAPGALAALVVHAGLIAALTMSIDWRSRQPEVVSAELWAAVPQAAAPPSLPPSTLPSPAPSPAPAPALVAPAKTPPPPTVARPPTQPDPDIAIDRERRLKAEKQQADKQKADEKKAEEERKKREAAAAAATRAAEEKAEDERLAKQRQENLRRIMGQAGSAPGATGNTGMGTQNAAPSANYLARLRKMLRDQIIFNGTVPGNAATEVSVNATPSGTITRSHIEKSSGLKEWDDAVTRALEKVGSLPRDADGRVPPSFVLVFRQND